MIVPNKPMKPSFLRRPQIKYVVKVGDELRVPCKLNGISELKLYYNKEHGSSFMASGDMGLMPRNNSLNIEITDSEVIFSNITEAHHRGYSCSSVFCKQGLLFFLLTV